MVGMPWLEHLTVIHRCRYFERILCNGISRNIVRVNLMELRRFVCRFYRYGLIGVGVGGTKSKYLLGIPYGAVADQNIRYPAAVYRSAFEAERHITVV